MVLPVSLRVEVCAVIIGTNQTSQEIVAIFSRAEGHLQKAAVKHETITGPYTQTGLDFTAEIDVGAVSKPHGCLEGPRVVDHKLCYGPVLPEVFI